MTSFLRYYKCNMINCVWRSTALIRCEHDVEQLLWKSNTCIMLEKYNRDFELIRVYVKFALIMHVGFFFVFTLHMCTYQSLVTCELPASRLSFILTLDFFYTDESQLEFPTTMYWCNTSPRFNPEPRYSIYSEEMSILLLNPHNKPVPRQ